MPEMNETCVRVNGVDLAVFEQPGEEPAVFFAHATGFHARCWDQVVERLPGRRCVALDMRGHGRSAKPPPPYNWRTFGEDVAAVAHELGLKGALGVGHSKGGYAVTIAAAAEPDAFARLLLVDPVIFREEQYATYSVTEHFAARRRNEWTSPAEMFERFKDRPPFDRWDPAVLRDYCDYGLLPAPAGDGYVLACPPEIEAATYAGSLGANPYPDIARVRIPVRILRARGPGAEASRTMSSSPTDPDLASRFAEAEDVFLPGHTHFIPMEDAGLVAAHIVELLETMAAPGARRAAR
jgi:pimeloyl-ACP methyl ester carboxylesterase